MLKIIYLEIDGKTPVLDFIYRVVEQALYNENYRELAIQVEEGLRSLEKLVLPSKRKNIYFRLPKLDGEYKKQKAIGWFSTAQHLIYEFRMNHEVLDIGLRIIFFMYMHEDEIEYVLMDGLIKNERNPIEL